MRNRSIEKHLYLSEQESKTLKTNAKKCGLNESVYLRQLITNYRPKEKPDMEFYKLMREMLAVGNNLNQIAKKASAFGYIQEKMYKTEAETWNKFRLEIMEKFLSPDKA